MTFASSEHARIKEGVVRWFDFKKGYGFIQNAVGVDVFVHYSVLPGEQGSRSLNTGDIVRYVEGLKTDGQLYAVRVVEVTRIIT